MIVIGIDAGVHLGIAALDVHSDGRATWLRSLTAPAARGIEAIEALIVAPDSRPALLVVEVPSGTNYGQRPNTTALLNARGIGERIAGYFEARGLQVVVCTARDWRAGLCSNPSANDAAVKGVCQLRIARLPKRSSNHERDAMGAAIWAAFQSMRPETRRTAS